jgi:hypothetical protein
MATYHSIMAGTDHQNTVFRLAALGSVNIVAFVTVVLILAARRSAIASIRAEEQRRGESVTGVRESGVSSRYESVDPSNRTSSSQSSPLP